MKLVALLVLLISIKIIFIKSRYDVSTSSDRKTSDRFSNPIKKSTNDLHVSLNDIEENLRTSFASLRNTLDHLIGCELTRLSSASSILFTMFNDLPNITLSTPDKLSTLTDALPRAFSSINDIIIQLNIGTGVMDAVNKVQNDLLAVIRIGQSELDIKKLDDAILLSVTSLVIVVNTVAVIAEHSTIKLGSISTEVQEVLLSLILSLHSTLVIAQNVYASVAFIVSSSSPTISSTLNLFLVRIDGTLQGIAQVIILINSSLTSHMATAVGTISVTLSSLTASLNESLEKIEASNVLKVTDTLQVIVNRFASSIGNFSSTLTNSVISITTSLTIVSSSDAGLQSIVARQLYPVFKTLLQLTGSDHEIATNLKILLTSIFDTIVTSTNRLTYGIGVEVIGSVLKSIKDIKAPLNGLLSLTDVDFSSESNVKKVDGSVREIAKTVQIFGSTVTAISSTIGKSIDSLNAVVLEVDIGLQFIFASVFYVVEWCISSIASIFLSATESENDSLSALSVFSLALLQIAAKITGNISDLVNDSLFSVINSITPLVRELGSKVVPALSAVSLITTETNVQLAQLTQGSGTLSGSIKDTATVANVSEILTGLTGSLSSLSSPLTPPLSSLKSALKEITSPGSASLKMISNRLIFVLAKLGEITGSPSQILHSTSNTLRYVFGQLFSILSKLSILNDVSIVLGSSVYKISTALYSLINAVDDCTDTFYLLHDPVKNVAKNVQILISTFWSIITAASNASDDILSKCDYAISVVPFVVYTVLLAVQEVLSAIIVSLVVTFGLIPTFIYQLTLSLFAILQSLLTIITNFATLVVASAGNFALVIGEILTPVSELQTMTSYELSLISGVKANKQTLRLNPV